MSTTPSPEPFVTFDTWHTESRAAASGLADALAAELRDRYAPAPGFAFARVHLGLDGRTVVTCTEWDAQAHWTAAAAALPAGAALRTEPGSAFRGTRAAHVAGPEAGTAPGIVSIATRHVGTAVAARSLLRHLLDTADWKRTFPGFVSATPFISLDGGTYLNYPQWTDEAAYRAYMTDPRNAAAQGGIAALEVAPPEFVMAVVHAQVTAADEAGAGRVA
ncbi:antibiotic biosynthesis monooxygenase family protein [Streptomyces sp. NPDC086023]|uniref:antibiotic biosynthesis monooxygenase family protein n=1 Tax=Streptomyces sp. NPDC086023 TaxID=3365746 RepID=UPI0037D2D2A5